MCFGAIATHSRLIGYFSSDQKLKNSGFYRPNHRNDLYACKGKGTGVLWRDKIREALFQFTLVFSRLWLQFYYLLSIESLSDNAGSKLSLNLSEVNQTLCHHPANMKHGFGMIPTAFDPQWAKVCRKYSFLRNSFSNVFYPWFTVFNALQTL